MTDRIAAALEAFQHARSPADFACRLTLPSDALRLSVTGVGDVPLPVTPARAKALAGIARPAPFGLGEETLLDPAVRDVGEIAKSRVRIDARRWKAALAPALERIREELGLPDGTLEARLHKLLVYGKGQFFLPHRDTERGDDMLGTLVVVLPSAHRGGTLVIEHKGETRRFLAPRASAAPALTLLAFYADCTHEVRPVTEGTRLTLSYQLHFTPAKARTGDHAATAVTIETGLETLVQAVGEFFEDAERTAETEVRHPWNRTDRLVCLLDHEYSSRSLAWPNLKGADGSHALALRYAALALDLHPWLAHVNIDETWSAQPTWGEAGYELEELIDRGATLEGWRDARSEPNDFPSLHARESELCRDDGLENTEPEHEEYEGWMGNYGDTLERRYRCSAIVLWPARRHHRVLLDMGADTLLRELARETADGDETALDRARDGVRSVLGKWTPQSRSGSTETLVATLALCERFDDPALALELLAGFRLVTVTPHAMPALIALGERFGPLFCRSLAERLGGAPLAPISDEAPPGGASSPSTPGDRPARIANTRDERRPEPAYRLIEWLGDFTRFCERVRRSDGTAWATALPSLFDRLHTALRETHRDRHATAAPSVRERAIRDELKGLVALVDAARAMGDDDALARVLETLREDIDGYRPEVPVRVLEHVAGKRARATSNRRSSSTSGRTSSHPDALDALRTATFAHLHTALERSDRDADDWRIEANLGCDCEDCRRLGTFLAARDERALDLPLAQARRGHLHRRIDGLELPLSHETRRQGRPYTLELRKLATLFKGDRDRHARAKKLLERLDTMFP